MLEMSKPIIENVIIQKMQPSDIEEVQKIEEEGNLENWSFQGYLEELENPDSFCVIAKYNSKIVGFLVSRLIMSNHSIEIFNIGVLNKYKRNKIATKLIENLFKILSDKNLNEIWLEVRSSNIKAIKFYQKNKFVIRGERKSFYTNPIEDAILMCRTK